MTKHAIGLALFLTAVALPHHSALAEPQPDSTSKALAIARVDSLHATGKTELVHAALDTLFQLSEARSDSTFHLALLLRRGHEWASYRSGQRGETVLRRARELALSLQDSASLSIALRWLGVAVGSQGRFSEAENIYRQTVDISQRIGHRSNEAWGHVGLGWCAERTGRFEEGKRNYRTAAELFAEIGDTRGRIWALNGLCTCFKDLGRSDSTMTTYEEIIAMARESGNPRVEAMARNNLGTVAYALGDPGSAMEHFLAAEELQTQDSNDRGAIVSGHNTVDCLIQLGRTDEAEARLRNLLTLCRDRGYEDLEASVRTYFGHLFLRQNRYENARLFFRDVVAERRSWPVTTQMDAMLGLSDALAMVDSSAAAERLLREVLSATTEVFSAGQRVRLMRSHAERLVETGQPVVALQVAGKARLEAANYELALEEIELLTLSAEAFRLLGQTDSVLVFLSQAADRWEAVRRVPNDPEWREQRSQSGYGLYTELAHAILAQRSGCSERDRHRTAFNRLQAFKSRTLLERMLGPATSSEVLGDSAASKLITLDELQQQILLSGELLLDTYVGPNSSILFAVTREECRVSRLPSEPELATRIGSYRDLLTTPGGDDGSPVSPKARATIRSRLTDALFSNADDLLLGASRIFIAPDGPLNLIPLDELIRTRNGSALCARIPSATILAEIRRPTQKTPAPADTRIHAIASGITGSGRAIPGAIDEVRSLGRALESVETTILGPSDNEFDATQLGKGEILHLAAHVTINDQSPWLSRVELGSEERSKSLHAGRIAMMQIPARLVVLSGCESGTGRVLAGEGVLGLTSAFLSAGVPTVVASLWPVDDRATVAFMLEFYDALADGLPSGSALAKARSRMQKTPRTQHPFYWAGFILVGDPDAKFSVERRSDQKMIPYLLIGLAIAIAGYLALRRPRRW